MTLKDIKNNILFMDMESLHTMKIKVRAYRMEIEKYAEPICRNEHVNKQPGSQQFFSYEYLHIFIIYIFLLFGDFTHVALHAFSSFSVPDGLFPQSVRKVGVIKHNPCIKSLQEHSSGNFLSIIFLRNAQYYHQIFLVH